VSGNGYASEDMQQLGDDIAAWTSRSEDDPGAVEDIEDIYPGKRRLRLGRRRRVRSGSDGRLIFHL
jgi:hypothetical protein